MTLYEIYYFDKPSPCTSTLYIQLGPVIRLGRLGASKCDLTLRPIMARPENSNKLAPNRDLMLKTRASKHTVGKYFGTKDKMAVII